MDHVRKGFGRALLVLGAAAALVFSSGSTAATQPPRAPIPTPASTWAPGLKVSYTETVADVRGNVLSTTNADGIPAGKVFGNASLANSTLGNATTFDAGSDLDAAAKNTAVTRGVAACCSSSGQDTVDVVVVQYTLFGSVAWIYHQVSHWCWSYPHITCLTIGSRFSDADGLEVANYSDHGYGWYYTWSGAGDGGHYAERDGSISNCILRYGCIRTLYPYIEMWLNGNGAWAADGGGTSG